MTSSQINVLSIVLRAWNVQVPTVFFPTFAIFMATMTTFLANVNFIKDLIANPNPLPSDPPLTFDFVIVGAGTAGSVIANRLSENGLFSVLLLEAGGDPVLLNNIPYLRTWSYPETDWMYSIVPQRHSCFSSPNNSIAWPREKAVGGCSNHNAMLYTRGNPNDFDNWAHLTQDHQWKYQNVLPFFKKSENYQGNFPFDPKYHGNTGPLIISKLSHHPLLSNWLDAGKQIGFSIKDPNTQQTSAFFPIDEFSSNGMRWEQYKGYIRPALERPNLKIVRYARVTKVNLDANNTATGVTYIRNQIKFTVLASKELIMSAGVINSPQLLMLSGIGPAEHLKSIGISPIINLPGVGQHLTDHPGVLLGPFILNNSVSFIPERDLTTASAIQYLKHRTGQLSVNFATGGAFISTTDNPLWPNLQIFIVPLGISEDSVIGSDLYQTYYKGFVGRDSLSVYMALGRPKSLGSITLQSNDPFDNPLIDPDYFAEPEDIQAMVEGFKFVIGLIEGTAAFQKYNATLIPNLLPGCEAWGPRTDEYFECFARHLTGTSFHPASTCKMGLISDPLSVVDSHLRVKFVGKLRIADASIMPYTTNANFNAPVTMIGEKASDLILKAWNV